MNKRVWSIIGILVGVLSVVCGIYFIFFHSTPTFYRYNYSESSFLSGIEFGADFYTDVYKAAAFSGNALAAIYKLIPKCFGYFFTIIGAVDICAFAFAFPSKKQTSSDYHYNLPIYNDENTTISNEGNTDDEEY